MVVSKQSGGGPELVHCHVTRTLEAFMTRAVTPVGVGGAGSGRVFQISYSQQI